ncbi:MAG: hypothetical protein QMD20_05830 [Candidatus Bathyarchaeia archaeon]|nr:hypothetical protein [Candidatus Bathyarchaeia archaeon]
MNVCKKYIPFLKLNRAFDKGSGSEIYALRKKKEKSKLKEEKSERKRSRAIAFT